MKMSVYVPDELWNQALSREPDLKASTLLQDLLRKRLSPPDTRSYAQNLPEELVAKRVEVRQHVLEELTEAYRDGYFGGLGLAEKMDYDAFTRLEELNWNLAGWWREDHGDSNFQQDHILQDYKVHIDDVGCPTGVFGEGVTDAIREVWQAAVSGRGPDRSIASAAGPEKRTEAGNDQSA